MEGKNKLGTFWNESYTDDNYWDEMKNQDLENLRILQEATRKMKRKDAQLDKGGERARVHNKNYVKTPEGLAASLSNQTKASSKRRGFESPSWNTASFKDWLLNDDKFNSMYKRWSAAKYITTFKPTIQRIDTNKGYEFDNMKVVMSKDKKYEK